MTTLLMILLLVVSGEASAVESVYISVDGFAVNAAAFADDTVGAAVVAVADTLVNNDAALETKCHCC